jgi:ABC-type transport system involved in multi-copper enzyme maturation permease subunit
VTALVMSELRQRIRGRRWWLLLALWTLVLAGLVALVRASMKRALEFAPDPDVFVGATMFGSLALFVLALACLVLPSLTATAVNGERDRGTLAVLQATLYRPSEIIGAKFASAMITASAFLLATLPITLWSMSEGGIAVGRAAAVYLILFVFSVVLIALALMASAVIRKPSLSAVLAYGFVFALTVGSPILFGLALATAPRDVAEFGEPRVGWRWVVLAPDPFVVLADAAPRSSSNAANDPLEAIRGAARYTRDTEAGVPTESGTRDREPPPLWPTGLTIDLTLAGAATYVAVRQLRVPARRLRPGQRIA